MMQISALYTALSAVPPTSSTQGSLAAAARQSQPQDLSQPGHDRISLSPEGLEASRENSEGQKGENPPGQTAENNKSTLTAEELKQLSQLRSRDREVRTHEQAHLSVAGQHAAGGEVPIDTGSESTPEATIQKMRTIRRAALAPAEPSGADRQIAAQASAKELQARQEVAAELQKDLSGLVSADISARNKKDNPSLSAVGSSPSDTSLLKNSRKMMLAAYQRLPQLG